MFASGCVESCKVAKGTVNVGQVAGVLRRGAGKDYSAEETVWGLIN
jgi:hypothetical protein